MRSLLALVLVFALPLGVFGAMVIADRAWGAPGRGYGYVVSVDLPAPEAQIGLPPIEGPQDAARPLVVIDAGHGGKDPGAGTGPVREKQVTLALALALRDELLKQGGIRVALTRDDDRFIVLGDRSQIARRLRADVFVSIHADSNEDVEGSVRGGTVYVLSDKGTNEAATRIAARENAADLVNGVNLGAQASGVSAILVDLSQRQTQAHSEELAALVLREGVGRLPFRESTPQSAAFAVLKSPDVPSILFESGYINNADDVARLTSVAGRHSFAAVTGQAIRAWLARQSARELQAAGQGG